MLSWVQRHYDNQATEVKHTLILKTGDYAIDKIKYQGDHDMLILFYQGE